MGNFADYSASFLNYASTPEGKKKVLIWGGGITTGLIVIIIIIVVASTTSNGYYEKGSDALGYYPLIDGHNDLAMNIRKVLKNNITQFNFKNLFGTSHWTQEKCEYDCITDLTRLIKGKVGGVFWSAYVECEHKDAVAETLEQIDVIKRLVEQNKDEMMLAIDANDVHSAFATGKIASMIGVEGGHSIDSRMGVLRMYYEMGIRYMTLTHTCNLPWADAANNTINNLTDFGKNVVREMNRLGMMVDLSHVSDGVMRDALNVSKAPVIFSHSSVRALCNHTRNVPDDVLDKLKNNTGIIMVNFNPIFLCHKTIGNGTKNITHVEVMKHLNYIVDKIGIDHVGIGSDYDGMMSAPTDLQDASKFPALFDMLYSSNRTRWSVDNLEKLAGKNLIRVWNAVEIVRDQLRFEVPYQEWISNKYLDKNDKCRTKSDVQEDVKALEPDVDISTTETPKTTQKSTNSSTTSAQISKKTSH